jgi:arylsulfatase A-like enzyme/acetyl esterase/lipase
MLALTTCLVFLLPAVRADDPPRPNVLVILADDLGFSDLGACGGEIDTPNLDRLAADGLRFTQGYNTARCWPTRAALLTGYYPQAIGRDALPGGKGGAQGKRSAWARLLPERLAAAGYRSYHSGKWHVDGDPREQGFARSLDVLGAGQSNFFDPGGVTEDGKPITAGDDFYVTTAIGDHAVKCLAEHARDHAQTPFFHYVAFTAPHFPVQAPADVVTKYRERYLAGWDAVRAARVGRLRESGIVTTAPAASEPEVGPPYQPKSETLAQLGAGEVDRPHPWDSLTDAQRQFQATKMAIHAAMVDIMDREVGRIVAQLETMKAFENTLILFLSDNGASAEIMIRGEGHDPTAEPGSRKTFLCLGPGWSSAANTPFRRHKTWVHEGGIATPWIVHWPRGIAGKGELRRQPVHAIDLVPTVLEIARVPERQSQSAPPFHGRSFAPALAAAAAAPAHESLWWCHEGHRAVRLGDWKLVAARGKPWELYDLAADRCETKDLAASQPGRVAALEEEWNRIAEECRGLASAEEPPAKRPKPAPAKAAGNPKPPNVVIVFADDLGYGDPGCYGGTAAATPAIDSLAREGIRFTDFHVAQAVCSASRAALLTGCYPNRIGISGALGPSARHGIAAEETTLAELLQARGYRTAAVGKWHLGHHPQFLPSRHGFDEYFGLPYSNDMWPHHPEVKRGTFPPLPLFDGEQVVDDDVTPEDQATLTARYTARAVDFLERAGSAADGRPFFLYLAHSMPHVPLFAGADFKGKSPGGLYGDVLAEIDASVAAVLAALDRTGHADDTLVLVTSDNGPWLSYGNHGGSAGPLREGKGTSFEGGVRVPCVARLPGVIPAGTVCDAPAMTIDLLPTIASLTGERLPTDAAGRASVAGRPIDGRDIGPLLRGQADAKEQPAYCFWYADNQLQAVREGNWKLFFPHTARSMAGQSPGRDGVPGKYRPLPVGRALHDLATDRAESRDVAAEHPEVVARLEALAERARADLGDSLTKRRGSGVRPAGSLREAAAVEPPAVRPAAFVRHAAEKPPRPLAGRRPNIIYVMTDDQGYGDIAAHGNQVLQTPNLDRLHDQSLRLTEFHVSPTCAPTRSALLTGRHEFRSGITHTILERERLALDAVTLPQLLRRAAGYTTGIFGKWHLGDEAEYQPGRRGFDRVFIHGGGGIGQSYPGSCGDAPGNTYFDPVIRSDGEFVRTKGYCTDVFFGAALDWIDRSRQEQKPFFCYVTPNCPHAPYDCPPGSDEKYLAPLEAAGIKDPKQRATIARFYAMIENIDTNMGRLLAKLDEWGLAEDTLVVFSTDNGTAAGSPVFNDGMRGTKGTPHRGGTRVPSFWRWPGTLPAGVDVAAVTAHIDVLPTFCELAGATLPPAVAAKVEGRSLVPLLEDAEAAWPDRLLVTHVGRWKRGKAAESALRNCRIREGRWQLVNTKDRPDAWELYDLAADPGEQQNVAAEHPEVVARLGKAYDSWWESVQGDLVNEDLDGPAENPFRVAFRAQFGPDATAAPAGGPPAAEPAGKPTRPARRREKAALVPPVPPTLADVRYGDHPKQVLHFWKAAGATADNPAPLVFYIHGGGWQNGDRMSGLAPMLEKLLAAGLSVTSVEYRFISEAMAQGVEPPVKAPLSDAARALQFVRSKAGEWHIDKTRIAASGGSAGASSSHWIAFHDHHAEPASADPVARESTRLLTAAVTGAQTTLDPKQMQEWTPNSRYGGHAFGFMKSPKERDSQFEQFLRGREQILPWIVEYSPYALVTADDPPVYLAYGSPPALGKPEKDPTHTANFGVKLAERLAEAGVGCELVYPGAPGVKHATVPDYLIEVLTKKPVAAPTP